MRLLRVSDMKLVDFISDSIPPYAILSHTWGENEVIFEDMLNGTAETKSSYFKVENAAEQAATENLEYVWIDNCCINKSSSAELSEALNSMYAWYQNARVCYAYLSDVPTNVRIRKLGSEFARSKWFTRGFTLQELLAPKEVVFFSSEWKVIGKKTRLYEILSIITGIGIEYLSHKMPLSSASIANRMSWVANRETSRLEDIAYCLLGIFNINMPLLYGERERAFIRLQEEIMRQSDDQSIFAWRDIDADSNTLHGLLARSPRQFAASGGVVPYENWEVLPPYSMTNRGLRIGFHLKKCSQEEDIYVAALNCPMPPMYKDGSFLGISLKKLSSGDEQYARVNPHEFSTVQEDRGSFKTIFVRQTIQNAPSAVDHSVFPYHVVQLRKGPCSYYPAPNDRAFAVAQVIFPESELSSQKQIQHFKSTLGNTTESAPEFIYSSEMARKDWLPDNLPYQVSLPKTAKVLAGAIVFERRTTKDQVCVMLGSLGGFDIGFDATKLPRDIDLKAPEHHVLEMLQRKFKPRPVEEESLLLGDTRVGIYVSPWIHDGVKYYMVDLDVHERTIDFKKIREIRRSNRRYIDRVSIVTPTASPSNT